MDNVENVKTETVTDTAEKEGFRPFVCNVKVDKKEYMKLSMVNLKRFLGVKELVLYLVLLGAALGLFFGFRIWLFLLLFAIVNLLVVIAVGVFVGTSLTGYKYEFVKTGVQQQKFTVNEEDIIVENINADGITVFEEKHEKSKIDKLHLTKDRIFIFRSTAIYYYIRQEDVEDGRFYELQDFLKTTYPPVKFKLRKKIKQYPGYNNKE